MEGIDPYIVFSGIGVVILIVAGLFYKGKLTSFTFEKSKDKTKIELKADAPQAAQISPPAALPARDTIEN
ncbi:MAG: hypothetical protein IID17_13145, partial [Nitrospinae bacterium]|nr:hypothetical protein [Nitrospinota bacterium]